MVHGIDRTEGTNGAEIERPRSIFANPPLTILVLLVAVRAIVLVAAIHADVSRAVKDDDVRRFEQIATSAGTPYRDFEVEYMPLELVTIRLIAGDGLAPTAARLAVISFIADLAAAAALWYGWGRRCASLYLMIGLPLQSFILYRIDPMAVAFAIWSMALAKRQRDGPAGALLALAVLTKLWPAVLLPWFLLKRRWRVVGWVGALSGIGAVIWVAVGGIRGPWQVATFRGSTGWEIESTVGLVLLLVTGGPTRMEAGAPRIGAAPEWARGAFLFAILGILWTVWVRARREVLDPAGGPALTAVTALMALSPLFSIQYTCWLVPWASVGLLGNHRERTVSQIGVAIVLVGGVLAILYDINATPAIVTVIKVLLTVRNGFCIGLVAYWLVTGRRMVAGPSGRL